MTGTKDKGVRSTNARFLRECQNPQDSPMGMGALFNVQPEGFPCTSSICKSSGCSVANDVLLPTKPWVSQC